MQKNKETMTPKRIPIPSDLVLKVRLSDLYDAEGEAITIDDVSSIKLTFTAGGAAVDYEINIANQSFPDGVSRANSDDEGPYLVVCLCTSPLMPGQLALRSEVEIPDARFHDGLRKEMDEFLFDIILT